MALGQDSDMVQMMAACIKACRDCADLCALCAESCRRCAESCRQMSMAH